MSKRVQEGAGEEERVMAKSKPMMNVVSKTIEISTTMPSSSASGSPETLIRKPVARDTNEDTFSSSQVWQSNANLDKSVKPRATRKTQKVKGKNWPHNFWISNIEYPRKFFIGCKPGDDILDTNRNSLIWRIFVSKTMKAAVFVGGN